MPETKNIPLYEPEHVSKANDYPVPICSDTYYLVETTSKLVEGILEIDQFLSEADPRLLKLAKEYRRLKSKKRTLNQKFDEGIKDHDRSATEFSKERYHQEETKKEKEQAIDERLKQIDKDVEPRPKMFGGYTENQEQFRKIKAQLDLKERRLLELNNRKIDI